MEERKRYCRGCGKWKPLTDEYWIKRGGEDRRFRKQCRDCRNKWKRKNKRKRRDEKCPQWKRHYDKHKDDPEFRRRMVQKNLDWRRRNPADHKTIRRRWWYKRYGLTEDDYNRMYVEAGGCCAVCGKNKDRLCVDHCHETGVVRGLLCGQCNSSIGMLGDTGKSVQSAADYLKKSELRFAA